MNIYGEKSVFEAYIEFLVFICLFVSYIVSDRIMSAEASNVLPVATVNIPEITITEPSPVVQNQSMKSAFIQEKAAHEGYIGEPSQTLEQTEAKESASDHTNSATEQERDSSGEFSPAEDAIECVVSVTEVAVSEPTEPTPESSISDPDDFRTYRCNCNANCDGPYEYLWNILVSRYAVAFWMLAMGLPVSAGVMGTMYMFQCPAAGSLPNMIFTIGISLMVVLTLRICIIFHRLRWEDENSRSMLQTMNLICLFITLLFFLTESVTYWQMTASIFPGVEDFCHPTFTSYLFWWNIATTVFMLFIVLFPVA